jgi:hypothetical protein
VRGIHFEAWRPVRTLEKLHTKEAFIDGVCIPGIWRSIAWAAQSVGTRRTLTAVLVAGPDRSALPEIVDRS